MNFSNYQSPDDVIKAWQNDSASVTKITTIASQNSLSLSDAYHIFAHYVWPDFGNLNMYFLRATGVVKHPTWLDFLSKWDSVRREASNLDVTSWWNT